MICDDTTNRKVIEVVQVQCDRCPTIFTRSLKSIKQRRKATNGDDCCTKCARKQGASKRPQNTKEFTKKMRSLPAFIEAIKNRPSLKGEKNPMWGKKFSPGSKEKRSQIWRQRIGERATNWKGGQLSFNARIKRAIQRNYKWFHRVMDRDNKMCTECGSKQYPLDAHHKEPLSQIVKRITRDRIFVTDDEKYNFVLTHPDVVDETLSNGVTLCRECHRKAHKNWGSHNVK